MAEAIFETRIYRELDRRAERSVLARRYRGQIDSSVQNITKHLLEIRRYFHHFTDHCLDHSIRILESLGSLLTDDQLARLTSSELFLFIGASMVHDIGMVVAEHEVRDLIGNAEFLAERKAILGSLALPLNDDWRLGGIERLVVSEFIRRRHGRRCTLILNEDCGPCRQLYAPERGRTVTDHRHVPTRFPKFAVFHRS